MNEHQTDNAEPDQLDVMRVELGKQFAFMLELNNWDAAGLCDALDVAPVTVQFLFEGRHEMLNLKLAERIADAMNCDLVLVERDGQDVPRGAADDGGKPNEDRR